jgi:hypothetical protein
MIDLRLLMVTGILASAGLTACSDMTAPDQLVPTGISADRDRRSGRLHVEKECSKYFGRAGDFCTITFSSLKEIKVGSRVIYEKAAGADGILETDVRLVPPRRGKNIAFGHCSVDLNHIDGTRGCVWSGGTGKFKRFQATVALTVVGGGVLAWDGRYSFGASSHEDR